MKKGNEVDKLVKGDLVSDEIKLPTINDEIKEFDTESINNTLIYVDTKTEIPLTLLERYVAELTLKGYSPDRIAQELGVATAVVERTLNSKPVKAFIKQVSKEIREGIKDELVAIMRRTIKDKVRYIEEKYDGDFSKATRKDLPELVKMLDEMLKEEEKAKLGTSQNVFVQILNQVTD
jgi:predicted transcriptional regulator